MSLSADLWQAHQALALASLNHPFVQGIGDGSLPRTNFAFYVGQDAFFLEAFARAYSIAGAKAPNWQGFSTFYALAGGVLEELKLHQGYAQRWQVDLQSVLPSTATRQYTDFLLATAWGQPIGVTAVAMAPCMRLYAFIGQQLATSGIPDHAYSDWIRTYSSDQFVPLVQQLEQLVDQYGTDTPLSRATYRHAMVCERDFFQAAWTWAG